jgi:hypothetical protein
MCWIRKLFISFKWSLYNSNFDSQYLNSLLQQRHFKHSEFKFNYDSELQLVFF